MTYKCRVGDKMARPLLSVPVSWSTLKGPDDRKSGLPLRIQKKAILVNIDDMYFKMKQMFDHCDEGRGNWGCLSLSHKKLECFN